jgi:hypothetical protein
VGGAYDPSSSSFHFEVPIALASVFDLPKDLNSDNIRQVHIANSLLDCFDTIPLSLDCLLPQRDLVVRTAHCKDIAT